MKRFLLFSKYIIVSLLIFLITLFACSCDQAAISDNALNEEWQQTFESVDYISSLAVGDNGIYYSNTGAFSETTIYAARISNGKIQKQKIDTDYTEISNESGCLSSFLQYTDGCLYYMKEHFSPDSSTLYKYDTKTEETSVVLEGERFYSWIVSGDYLVFTQLSGFSEYLCFRKLEDSSKTTLCSDATAFAVLDNKVRYVTSKGDKHSIYEYNLETEKESLLATLNLDEYSSFAFGLDTVIAYTCNDEDSSLNVYSLKTNTLNEYELAGEINLIDCSQNYAFIGMQEKDGNSLTIKLYRFCLENGRTEFLFEDRNVSSIIAANDDVVFVDTVTMIPVFGKSNMYKIRSDGTSEKIFSYKPY